MGKAESIHFVELADKAPDIWERFKLDNYSWMYELLEDLNQHAPWLAKHSIRVAYMCHQLGKRLGICESELTELIASALTHDIGKLEIPIETLNTYQSDTTVFKVHVLAGYRILTNISEPETDAPAEIMKTHHKFQGDHYPDEVILDSGSPFYLRQMILGIGDATDAMLTDRPYQPAKSPEEVKNIINWRFAAEFDFDIGQEAINIRQSIVI